MAETNNINVRDSGNNGGGVGVITRFWSNLVDFSNFLIHDFPVSAPEMNIHRMGHTMTSGFHQFTFTRRSAAASAAAAAATSNNINNTNSNRDANTNNNNNNNNNNLSQPNLQAQTDGPQPEQRMLDNFNLENFDPAIFRQRHRLYSLILVRLAVVYFFSVPTFLRKLFEYAVLAAAITCFCLLVHLHMTFIRSPLTCLDHVKDTWPRNGILRVQINGNPLQEASERIANEEQIATFVRMIETYKWREYNATLHKYYVQRQFPITSEAQRLIWLSGMVSPYDLYRALPGTIDNSCCQSSLKHSATSKNIEKVPLTDADLDASKLKSIHHFSSKKNGGWDDAYVIEYSLEYGLLRLSEEMRRHYKVPVMTVQLCPSKDACFGDRLSRFMLRNFLGYDDVLIGSIKRLAENENNRGYVRNVISGEHFRFVNVWMTRASYLAAAFIMIVFTLFISMLIRYSHQQLFVFVSEFLRTLEHQQPFSRITSLTASLATVILALIGIEAIMYEFFTDSSITFHVIIMVWAADQFDSLGALSSVSRKHFLRFFYLYQFVFYAYHYRFNGQYAGLSLLTTMLFTYHSMIYFFHHFVAMADRNAQHHIAMDRQQLMHNNNHNANADAGTSSDSEDEGEEGEVVNENNTSSQINDQQQPANNDNGDGVVEEEAADNGETIDEEINLVDDDDNDDDDDVRGGDEEEEDDDDDADEDEENFGLNFEEIEDIFRLSSNGPPQMVFQILQRNAQ